MNTFMNALARDLPVCHALLTHRIGSAALAIAVFLLAAQWIHYIAMVMESENLVTRFGPLVGGDFVAFWTAGATPIGELPSIYDFRAFNARLAETFPQHGTFGLGWMYPPTMSLLVTPFGALPYFTAYWLWVGLFGVIFYAFVWRLWPQRLAFIMVLAAPAAFQGIITGQTGLLTAVLVGVLALNADRRPVLAGLAAALLTVKPQLGLLIPLAFLGAGAWRAFGVAALASIALAAIAYVAFGALPWAAFVTGLAEHSARLNQSGFPFHKLATPYGGAMMLGLGSGIAGALQLMVLLGLGAFVFIAWRRLQDPDLRLIALGAAIPLATPYAFYYELAIMIAPVLLVARRGATEGWLPMEKQLIGVVWIAPLFMPGASAPAAPMVFIVTLIAFGVCARRIAHHLGFRFASEASMQASGS